MGTVVTRRLSVKLGESGYSRDAASGEHCTNEICVHRHRRTCDVGAIGHPRRPGPSGFLWLQVGTV